MPMRYRKVIVVGLDGLEPSLALPLMDAGELPNLGLLRARGGFGPVATTAPAQTPVAWSSFATGVNPGGHGIFDFLGRDPATYRPDIALNRHERAGALGLPKVTNRRRGTPLWDLLAKAGVDSAVIRCPCTYPPEPVRGTLLSGMGVPDLRGGFGTGTFYTTADGIAPGEAEQVVRLERVPEGAMANTHLLGPRGAKGDLRAELIFAPVPGEDRLAIRAPGTSAEVSARVRGWTEWLPVKFKAGLLQSVRGMVRFYVARIAPELEVYASPVNFDPRGPAFPISHPPEFAAELAEAIGPYHTTGMVEDHAGLSNGRLDEAAFLDQCDRAWREREGMMVHELERLDSGFFYALFDTPDRVQHMLWRHREPDHPANRESPARAEWARAIEDQYRRADAMVGTALEFADDETLVIALSDHGFGSFRRGFDLNRWLLERGFLGLKDGRAPGPEAGDLLSGIDWSRTKAYALGLGGIYLNLRGREGEGIVPPEEVDSLASEIASGLTDLVDPATNAVAVRSARRRAELYRGPCAEEAPDLVAHFAPGYRVAWESSLGGVAPAIFSDNVKMWSGDHVIDPALVPGCLWMNVPFRAGGARLIDLAPTILGALGVPVGAAMEGATLLP